MTKAIFYMILYSISFYSPSLSLLDWINAFVKTAEAQYNICQSHLMCESRLIEQICFGRSGSSPSLHYVPYNKPITIYSFFHFSQFTFHLSFQTFIFLVIFHYFFTLFFSPNNFNLKRHETMYSIYTCCQQIREKRGMFQCRYYTIQHSLSAHLKNWMSDFNFIC